MPRHAASAPVAPPARLNPPAARVVEPETEAPVGGTGAHRAAAPAQVGRRKLLVVAASAVGVSAAAAAIKLGRPTHPVSDAIGRPIGTVVDDAFGSARSTPGASPGTTSIPSSAPASDADADPGHPKPDPGRGAPESPGTVEQPAIPPAPAAPRAAAGQPLAAGGFTDPGSSGAAATPGSSPSVPAGSTEKSVGRAAAAARPVPSLLVSQPALHLLRRATFGPRASDHSDVARFGIDGWLDRQLQPQTIADPLGDSAWRAFPLAGAGAAVIASAIKEFRDDAMMSTVYATLCRQLFSTRQLYEVVVDVMANHLNVPLPFDTLWQVGPSYQSQVIRPHALGRFEDLLLAAMRHPAMLVFLNNDESTRTAVNENLGRELLELHTVGISGGYTESDVRNSAYVLSGRTVDQAGGFVYKPGMHYVGAVRVLGWSAANGSAADGLSVGDSYLKYLANLPATARNVCRKLAARFVADSPSEDLVTRLAAEYIRSGTDLTAVLRALFATTDFWSAIGTKTRRPNQDLVATLRALDVGIRIGAGADLPGAAANAQYLLRTLGDSPLGWTAPNGYPDLTAAWNDAGGLLGRWNNHRAALSGRFRAGFTVKAPGDLLTNVPKTYGEYVDQLCVALTGQTFSQAHRGALLTFLGARAADPVVPAILIRFGAGLAALIFDSPYFQLR